jgi:uncharacterized Zn-binding protein involved in type VI secretion
MSKVARKNGADTVNTGHGCDSTTVTDVGSSSVFVNGIGVCRKGDRIKIHTIPSGSSCVPHTAVINVGSSSVFVNGIAIARLGDSADAGNISSGSNNVFAGG